MPESLAVVRRAPQEGDFFVTSVPAVCQITAAELEADVERGANCTCSEYGTRVNCVDTMCESCNPQNTSCARNKDSQTFSDTTEDLTVLKREMERSRN